MEWESQELIFGRVNLRSLLDIHGADGDQDLRFKGEVQAGDKNWGVVGIKS